MVLNLFGLPSSIHCISSSDKRFNLNVDTRYKLIAKFNEFKVLLNVNMFNKNIKRNFSIFYNTGNYSIYNLNDNYRSVYNKKMEKIFFENKKDLFEKQINYFFKFKNSDFKKKLKRIYMNNLFLKKAYQSIKRRVTIHL